VPLRRVKRVERGPSAARILVRALLGLLATLALIAAGWFGLPH
jgi:hypothetical protein